MIILKESVLSQFLRNILITDLAANNFFVAQNQLLNFLIEL